MHATLASAGFDFEVDVLVSVLGQQRAALHN